MSKSNKDNKFDPDELTAPLYEDGERPKFDTGLKIVIGSVISLMILGVLFFVFADKIKQWTGGHHPTINHGTSSNSLPSDTASDKTLQAEPTPATNKYNDDKHDHSEEEDTHKKEEDATPTDHHHNDHETDHTHHPEGWNE